MNYNMNDFASAILREKKLNNRINNVLHRNLKDAEEVTAKSLATECMKTLPADEFNLESVEESCAEFLVQRYGR